MIKVLQEELKKHGDLDVVVRDDDYSYGDGDYEEIYSYIDNSSFKQRELYNDNDCGYSIKVTSGDRELKSVLTIQSPQ